MRLPAVHRPLWRGVLAVFIVAAGRLAVAQTQEVARSESEQKRAPVVRMDQSAVMGRVIFLGDDKREESAAAGVRIEIRTKEKKLIAETKTDDSGMYSIPKLDVGAYDLVVGRLRLELEVEATKAPAEGETEDQSKVIVLFIPREVG